MATLEDLPEAVRQQALAAGLVRVLGGAGRRPPVRPAGHDHRLGPRRRLGDGGAPVRDRDDGPAADPHPPVAPAGHDPAPGRPPRPVHRPDQPVGLPRAARGGRRGERAAADRGALHRPRRVQGRERRARPPGRRRGAGPGRPADHRCAAAGRRGGSARRRRVRRALPAPRRRRGRRRHRRAGGRRPRAAVRRRRRPGRHRGQRRHRHHRARPARRRAAHRRGRPGALPGQGRGPGSLAPWPRLAPVYIAARGDPSTSERPARGGGCSGHPVDPTLVGPVVRSSDRLRFRP